ncbi:MAG: YeeE/YedE thiosulfate transporter family protein [Cetobacterium sp.]|uniref:YeeE/YedE thiosulfate transporter family protein n=1 Tax=Cetobacterium sp. TaxID=2071632 RepID=UPI002FC59DB0
MNHLFVDNMPLLGIVLGILFGFALFYAGATNRVFIINMLKLKDLTLMKIILLGIGFGMTLTYLGMILKIIPVEHFSIKVMNLGVIFGAGILGVGFGMIGLCPGTAIASFGAGYSKAIYVILGGLVGAFLFTMSYPVLKSIGLFKELFGGKTSLIYISEKYNFLYEGTPWIGVFIGVIIIVISLALPYSFENKKR